MNNNKTAILLINVGTPDKPTVKSVRKFLSQFLNDKQVIDLPWLVRKILVNLIIVPFRALKSAKMYKKLWNSNGSPLLHYSKMIREMLQEGTSINYDFFIGMRYGNPGIADSLKKIQSGKYSKLVILPLFPQYAAATTGTSVEAVFNILDKWKDRPETNTIWWFFNHPAFIRAYTERIKRYNPEEYDHIIFSYHSLPLSHITKIHKQYSPENCQCEDDSSELNPFCYRNACYETTRLLINCMGIDADKYSVAFQSRFSKNWLSPFTDDTIRYLALNGKKRLLVVCPSFVSDCLETTVEIGMEYNKLFESLGGETLKLVESLNDMPEWIGAIEEIIQNH